VSAGLISRNRPFTVDIPGKEQKIPLVVMNATDGLPAAFALMGTRAQDKVALRIGGGCKGMGPEDKDQMVGFFARALAGYRGIIWSGATRQVDAAGMVDPMVTDVPGVIARSNPECVALGTVPRTELLTLQGESRLVLDQYGTVLNPTQSGILIVQNGPDGSLGWDGDVETYFKLMNNWGKYAGFAKLGLLSWNGGEVTKLEIIKSTQQGWPTILIEGSGRVTDEIIKAIRAGTTLPDGLKPEAVRIVNKDDPRALRKVLINDGFLADTTIKIGISRAGQNLFIDTGLNRSGSLQVVPDLTKDSLLLQGRTDVYLNVVYFNVGRVYVEVHRYGDDELLLTEVQSIRDGQSVTFNYDPWDNSLKC
jgi:hypothetical protein